MPKLSRILVPVEFSPRCRGAVEYAEALACHFHCEIVLLHAVIPPLANYSSLETVAYEAADDLAREIAAKRVLDLDAFPCEPPDGVSVRRVVLTGDPTGSIVDYAASEHCDMIVMPTHGYGPFRRLLLGSVTAKVLHDAVCPVWTGPHMESTPAWSKLHFQHVVCALNLGPHSREVLGWAAEFAREFGARLSIVHAIPISATRLGGFYFDPDWRIELTKSAAERLAYICKDMKIDAAIAIEAGEAPAVVDTFAANTNTDLIVIGRGSTPRAHGHLPTHSYAIVRQSSCPVVTI